MSLVYFKYGYINCGELHLTDTKHDESQLKVECRIVEPLKMEGEVIWMRERDIFYPVTQHLNRHNLNFPVLNGLRTKITIEVIS